MSETMRDRIKEGKLFTDNCEGLPKDRRRCKSLLLKINKRGPKRILTRFLLQRKLFRDKKFFAWIEPPFYCCYGYNIKIGKMSYINFNCNFIDDGEIIIGERVMFGANVTIATVGHPLDPSMREYMYTDPVVIEDDCWIGAGVTICPGFHIGKGTTI